MGEAVISSLETCQDLSVLDVPDDGPRLQESNRFRSDDHTDSGRQGTNGETHEFSLPVPCRVVPIRIARSAGSSVG